MQNDYEMPMKELIKTVVRTFYEPQHVVITDILLENILLSDTDFCSRMKMLSREFNKLIIRLKDDKLIKSDIKVEVKEDNKQNLKTVYFFNYAEVRDIIKYKIFKMTKALEIKRMSADEAFYCQTCEKSFSALDAQASMDNFVFKCIFCKNELHENVAKNEHNGVDLTELFNSLENIIGMLKETDKFKIPTLDYFQVLELKKEKEEAGMKQHTANETKKALNASIMPETGPSYEEYSDDMEQDRMIQEDSNRKVESIEEDYVIVNGIKKPYSQVTDEDKELMNEDEYIKYFEIYSKHNG